MNKFDLEHLKKCEFQKGIMEANKKLLDHLDSIIADTGETEALKAWRDDVETDYMEAKAWLIVNDEKSDVSKEFVASQKKQPDYGVKPKKKKAVASKKKKVGA